MILTDFACKWSAASTRRSPPTRSTAHLHAILAKLNDPQPPRTALDDVVTRPADHPRYDWYDKAGTPLEIGHPDPEATIFHLRRSGGVARWPVDHDRLTHELLTSGDSALRTPQIL